MKLYCIPVQYQIILNDIIFSSTFKNFHFIPFISPSPLCFYNCRTVGSIRPTFPLISIFGQKLYTRCLFSSGSPGKRLLYYFPVFRTQFSIARINNLFVLSLIDKSNRTSMYKPPHNGMGIFL